MDTIDIYMIVLLTILVMVIISGIGILIYGMIKVLTIGKIIGHENRYGIPRGKDKSK